ncbi:MAG: HAMP domain-containing histidine kinase [Lachnospiraceae bacterium]|nr:HAMP domain-containing histidine kinase [Lachnospiraceae bacterium]
MNQVQKILIAGACIFYAATIYCFFHQEPPIIVLFFLLHSLCLILFSYRTYREVLSDKESIETFHQDIGLEIAEKNRALKELQETMGRKDKDRNEMAERIEALQLQENGFRERIASLESDLETVSRESKEKLNAMVRTGANQLLPPLSPEHDEKEAVNIIKMAHKAKDALHVEAVRANLHINISSANDVLMVHADPNRLECLFKNIIDNSIKYMKRAGALVITFSSVGDGVFVALKDTGMGLSEDETAHIFEINYQGSNRVSGTGLGLAQVRCIVEYYGGTIYAKSTKGKGMGIYIQFPA